MPKTLISFIGTGPFTEGESKREYRKAKYTIGGKEAGESSFVSAVLYEHLAIDKLILIGTVKSMWEEVYRYFCEQKGVEPDMDYYVALAESGESGDHRKPVEGTFDKRPLEAVLGAGSRVELIPYGLNRDEQWQIFEILNRLFETLDEDEIYLDVTHAFRSLPLFSMTVLMYLEDVREKRVALRGVYYGMLETMREFGGKAPIVDLSLILELQKWIKGAYALMHFGKGDLVADLLGDTNAGRAVREFSDVLALNYLHGIETGLNRFSALADKMEEPVARMVVSPVLKEFAARLLKHRTHAARQLELSVWHREHHNYLSAYLVLVEAMITHRCERRGWRWEDYKHREKAKKQLRKNKMFKEANKIRNNLVHHQNKHMNTVGENIRKLIEFQTKFQNLIKTPL